MLNFWYAVWGLLLIIAGVLSFVILTRRRINGDRGGYGNHTQMYTAAIGMITVGLIMLIRELMKL